jgi:sugar fermentation stimulation protein A
VYLERSSNPKRKTAYDLVAVRKGERLINMDSQIPNGVVKEWLEQGGLFEDLTKLRPETKHGNSRFDFYMERGEQKIFMEVKGVTLEEDGILRFPDAPTERGVKHIQELTACIKEGYEAYIFFVIQMKDVRWFEPNDVTHPAFGEALREAAKCGVHILAYNCLVEPDEIRIYEEVEVKL